MVGPESQAVLDIIRDRVAVLEKICDSFLEPIFHAVLPLGMRFICKVLREVWLVIAAVAITPVLFDHSHARVHTSLAGRVQIQRHRYS